MKRYMPFHSLLAAVSLCFIAQDAAAGGPWVLGKGQSYLTGGYSIKLGSTRWSPIVDNSDSPTDYSDDVITYELNDPHDSVTVNNKFHNFQYVYFQFQVGIAKNLELFGTINWLHGLEAQRSDPETGKLWTYYDENGNMVIGENGTYHYAVWEENNGFSDSWLGLKYQFKHGAWPMAIEVNSRFPDLYNEPTTAYTRFHYQYTAITNPATGMVYRDTLVHPGSEWRGLLKRDFAGLLHVGHTFLNGAIYTQGFAGYNIRQDAYADQLMGGISGGYNWAISDRFTVIPELWLDYVGGIGNGGQPDSTDRFYSVYKNYNFNNSKHFRMYLNANLVYRDVFTLKLGYGDWLWGRGEVNYNEYFAQLSYFINRKCD